MSPMQNLGSLHPTFTPDMNPNPHTELPLGCEARPIPVGLSSSGNSILVGKRTFRYVYSLRKIQYSDDFGAMWKDYVYKSTVYKFQGSFYELVVEDPMVPKGRNPYQMNDFKNGAGLRGRPDFVENDLTPPRYNTSQLPPFVKTFTEISSLPFQPPVAVPPEEDPENTSKRLTPGSGRRRKTLSSFIESSDPAESTSSSSDAGTWSDYWMLAHNGLSVVREPLTPPPRSLKPPPGLNSLISSLRSEEGVNDSTASTATSTKSSSSSPHPSPSLKPQQRLDDERVQWQRWAMYAAEMERNRRISVLREMELEEERERQERRAWAIEAIEKERQERIQNQFLRSMTSSTWFADTISAFSEDYEIICPYSHLGCEVTCQRKHLEAHIMTCKYRNVDSVNKSDGDQSDRQEDELICSYSVFGCTHCCSRAEFHAHLKVCRYAGLSRKDEDAERERWKGVVVKEAEEERQRRVEEDVEGGEMGMRKQSVNYKLLHSLLQSQMGLGLAHLHTDILEFARISTAHSLRLLPARQAALKGICNVVQGFWGDDAQALLYGSCATGLDTEDSDVDIVISFTQNNRSVILDAPTVAQRIDFLARYEVARTVFIYPYVILTLPTRRSHMSTIPWIRILASVTHGRVPVVKAVALVKLDGTGVVPFFDENARQHYETVEIPLDVSIDGPTHSGISSTSFMRSLTSRLSSLRPMVLVLKKLLAARNLNDPFSGGLSSYGLCLMVTFLLLKQRKLLARSKSGGGSEVASSFRSDNESNGTGGGDTNTNTNTTSSETPSLRKRSQSEGSGVGREVLAPEAQSTFGKATGKTILKQAGFLHPPQGSGRCDDGEGMGSSIFDDGMEWDDPDDLFGFTFYIQNREFEDDEEEEEDDEEEEEGEGEEKEGEEESGEEEEEDEEEKDKDENDDESKDQHKPLPSPVLNPSPPNTVPKAVQRSMAWQKKSKGKEATHSSMEADKIIFGQLLLDFFQFFGDDFDAHKVGFSIRGGGFTFPLHGENVPQHPLANDPVIIEDPLNATNNVGRTNFRISQLQGIFSDSLLAVKSGIAGGKTGVLKTLVLNAKSVGEG
ncbi:hypothetical protein TL16_g03684, partial [Triparma laevis f. inornata]